MKRLTRTLFSTVLALATVATTIPATPVFAEEKKPYVLTTEVEMPEGSALYGVSADYDYVPVADANPTSAEEIKELETTVSHDRLISFNSKKGLQGADLTKSNGAYVDLGVKQTLFNVWIETLFGNEAYHSFEHEYNGKTYYFNLPIEPTTVYQMNQAGWDVSVVLLLRDNVYNQGNLVYKNGIGSRTPFGNETPYYAWNLDDADIVEKYNALFDFLGRFYSGEDETHAAVIKNWIIGNEINMPFHYNATGTTDLGVNAQLAARQFQLVYDRIKAHNSNANIYISLDHSWTHNDEGRGIAGKSFIEEFAKRVAREDWCIAYHPYAPIMTNAKVWEEDHQNKSINTEFISSYNIEILTDFLKNNYGANHKVLLSEVGFTRAGGQDDSQAASLAYTYYKAEFNDMITGVIFRSLDDNAAEAAQGFEFGLRDGNGNPRIAYNVFKYMDTTDYQIATTTSLRRINGSASSWAELIPGFNPSKFESKYVDEDKIKDFVRRLYEIMLEREAEEGGFNYWTNELVEGRREGASVAMGFALSNEIKESNITDEEYLTRLYRAIMGREPDDGGFAYWMGLMNNGVTRSYVFKGFCASQEFTDICNSYGIKKGEAVSDDPRDVNINVTMFVFRTYDRVLNRKPDEEGIKFWTEVINSKRLTPKGVAEYTVFSDEFKAKNTTDEEFVTVLYRMYFDREPDEEGKNYWLNDLSTGARSRRDVFDCFAGSPEFAEVLASFGL